MALDKTETGLHLHFLLFVHRFAAAIGLWGMFTWATPQFIAKALIPPALEAS
jgi:hypothetical protein